MSRNFSQGTSDIGLEGVFAGGGVGSGLFSHPRGLPAQAALAGCQLTLRKSGVLPVSSYVFCEYVFVFIAGLG